MADKRTKHERSETDAKAAADDQSKVEGSQERDAELEDELDDSFPGSDAPTATRRSTKD